MPILHSLHAWKPSTSNNATGTDYLFCNIITCTKVFLEGNIPNKLLACEQLARSSNSYLKAEKTQNRQKPVPSK